MVMCTPRLSAAWGVSVGAAQETSGPEENWGSWEGSTRGHGGEEQLPGEHALLRRATESSDRHSVECPRLVILLKCYIPHPAPPPAYEGFGDHHITVAFWRPESKPNFIALAGAGVVWGLVVFPKESSDGHVGVLSRRERSLLCPWEPWTKVVCVCVHACVHALAYNFCRESLPSLSSSPRCP